MKQYCTHRFIETQSHADFWPDSLHAKIACKLRRLVIQLGERQTSIPRTHSLTVGSAQHLIMDGFVNAAIVELWSGGIPLADALPVVLREQIKLANSGVLSRKDFGKQLLKNACDTLHLFPRHITLPPFQEDADVSTQHLNMKTDLALRIVSQLDSYLKTEIPPPIHGGVY